MTDKFDRYISSDTDIEITPTVLRAGVQAYLEHDPMFFNLDEIIKAVCIAAFNAKSLDRQNWDRLSRCQV
jgi:hypothetical protein